MPTEVATARIAAASDRLRAEGFTPGVHYIAGYLAVVGSVEQNDDGSSCAVAWADGEGAGFEVYE